MGFLFSSCGTQAPGQVGSVVVACGLCCPMAHGILVPRPGIESMSPALEGRFFTTGPLGKSLESGFCPLVGETSTEDRADSLEGRARPQGLLKLVSAHW